MGEAQNVGYLQGDVHGKDDTTAEGVLDVVIDIGEVGRARRTTWPSSVAAGVPLVWQRMPLRTSQVRFSPWPFFSSRSTTRTDCW